MGDCNPKGNNKKITTNIETKSKDMGELLEWETCRKQYLITITLNKSKTTKEM